MGPKPEDIEVLESWAAENGITLAPDALGRIGSFVDSLGTWNQRTHLTGERDPSRLVRRHVADSLAVVPLLPAEGLVVDIGSGGGFPGIVLACMRPDLEIVLIEPRRRRTSFLREVIRNAGLGRARTLEGRAEAFARDEAVARKASMVITRALRMDTFAPLAVPLLAAGGRAIAMQTPRAEAAAVDVAAAHGLRLAEVRRYRLPDGDPRSLLLLIASVAAS